MSIKISINRRDINKCSFGIICIASSALSKFLTPNRYSDNMTNLFISNPKIDLRTSDVLNLKFLYDLLY